MSDIELPNTLYENSVLDWSIAFALILLSVFIGRGVYWLINNVFKKLTSDKTKLGNILIDMLEEPEVLIGVLS